MNSTLTENVTLIFDSDEGECPVKCVRSVPVSPDAWQTSFWSYLSVRIVLDVLRASSLMLFEGAVVVIIKEHGGDYGLQKLFGTAGAVVFSPIAGKIIDASSSTVVNHEDYTGLFVLYCVLRIVTAVLILRLKLGFKVNLSYMQIRSIWTLEFQVASLFSTVL